MEGADRGMACSPATGRERWLSAEPVVSETIARTRMSSAAHWTQDRRLLEGEQRNNRPRWSSK